MARAFGLVLLTGAIVLTACTDGRSSAPSPESTSSSAATGSQATPATRTTPAGSTASDDHGDGLVLGPDGFGPLKLGMTAAQAEKTSVVSGLSNFPGLDSTSSCRGIYLKAVPNHDAHTVDGFVSAKHGVVQISAAPGVHTPEGIGIGSTMTAVKAAYPGLTTEQGGPVTPVPGNAAAYYQFFYDRATNLVTKVSLAADNEDCFN